MTLEELNKYFRLLGQLDRARELLASLEAAAAPRSRVKKTPRMEEW